MHKRWLPAHSARSDALCRPAEPHWQACCRRRRLHLRHTVTSGCAGPTLGEARRQGSAAGRNGGESGTDPARLASALPAPLARCHRAGRTPCSRFAPGRRRDLVRYSCRRSHRRAPTSKVGGFGRVASVQGPGRILRPCGAAGRHFHPRRRLGGAAAAPRCRTGRAGPCVMAAGQPHKSTPPLRSTRQGPRLVTHRRRPPTKLLAHPPTQTPIIRPPTQPCLCCSQTLNDVCTPNTSTLFLQLELLDFTLSVSCRPSAETGMLDQMDHGESAST